MDKMSPEEKLLRLIKGAKKKDGAKEKQTQPQTIIPTPKDLPREKSIKQPSFAPIRTLKLPVFDLGLINKILKTLFIIIFLFFVVDGINNFIEVRRLDSSQVAQEEDSEFGSLPQTLGEDLSDYLVGIKERDIFVASRARGGLGVSGISLFDPSQYVNDLRLLGIISGDKPQAIIEDQNEKTNYTVSVGDYIKDFLVEEVGSGKVLLDYKGQKFDLFL